jgi:hypothetical protein
MPAKFLKKLCGGYEAGRLCPLSIVIGNPAAKHFVNFFEIYL